MSKVGFCRQKSKLVLFSHEILCCKTFQVTYYLFIYDIPNRSCVTLKYSSGETTSGEKRNQSLASILIVKLLECRLFLSTNHFVGFVMKTRLAFLSLYDIHSVYSKCYPLKSSQDHVCCATVLRNAH